MAGYRESGDLFIPGARELRVEIPVLALTNVADLGALPFRSKWVQIAQYPVSSFHIFGSPLAGLTCDVEVSNLTAEGAGQVVAGPTAIGIVKLDYGTAYARVLIKTLNAGGKIAVYWSGALQAA